MVGANTNRTASRERPASMFDMRRCPERLDLLPGQRVAPAFEELLSVLSENIGDFRPMFVHFSRPLSFESPDGLHLKSVEGTRCRMNTMSRDAQVTYGGLDIPTAGIEPVWFAGRLRLRACEWRNYGAYVFKDVVATMYPSGLCRVWMCRIVCRAKCANGCRHSITSSALF